MSLTSDDISVIMTGGKDEIIDLIEQKGVNAKSDLEGTPLHFTRDKDVVKYLLDNGADVNAKDLVNITPIGYYSGESKFEQNRDIIRLLLERDDIDVNVQSTYYPTILHVASK